MSITFTDRPSSQIDVLNMPTGDALEAAGILSEEQVNDSGHAQAMMIAIRSKIENGDLTQEAAIKALGEFKGVDFMTLLKKPEAERYTTLERLGVGPHDVKSALETVNEARENKGSVNAGSDIFIPQMGQIHTTLFRDEIDGFADINNGIMLSQRAIELSATAARIQRGEYDPELGSKRGFRTFPNDPEELQSAVKAAEELNGYESDLAQGITTEVDFEAVGGNVETILDNAQTLFKGAKQDALALTAQFAKQALVDDDGEPAPEAHA